jgi:hypothetical protein
MIVEQMCGKQTGKLSFSSRKFLNSNRLSVDLAGSLIFYRSKVELLLENHFKYAFILPEGLNLELRPR